MVFERKEFLFYLSIIALFVIAWLLQENILYSWDNSTLLHDTQRLLVGGTYANDFFEVCPPMILYLYIPPVLLNNWLAIPIFVAFRIYIFLVTACSLMLCLSLIKQIFLKEDGLINYLFFLSLTAILLLFPMSDFGQREHLFLVLTLPYCFAVTCYLENKSISNAKSIFIGLLAGFGIAIKPFFIITPLMLELFILCNKKNWRACFRKETICIGVVLALYGIFSFLRHRDYFEVIVPYALHFYYQGIALPWLEIIFSPISTYCYLLILFYLVSYKTLKEYHHFINTLCITMLSFVLIFVMQRVLFYYHELPAFSLATALFELLLSLFILKFSDKINNRILFAFISISFIFAMRDLNDSWLTLVLTPKLFWGYLIFILSALFCIFEKQISLLKLCLSIGIVFAISYWFSYITLLTAPYESILGGHRFTFSLLLLLALFVLSVRQSHLKKIYVASLTIITGIVFAFPALIIHNSYQNSLSYKNNVKPLIGYMKQNMANQTVYLFSTNSIFVFPLIDYANVNFVSRFPYFWMIPELIKNKPQYKQYKNFLIEIITDDLNNKKPDYVLVDVTPFKKNMLYHFDYLSYFLSNKKFAEAWKKYHYLSTLDGEPSLFFSTYHFAIYKRIKNQTI